MKKNEKFILIALVIAAITIVMLCIVVTVTPKRKVSTGAQCFIETDKTWDYPLYELHEMRDCEE